MCVTPEFRGRGRLYSLTQSGGILADSIDRESAYPIMTPKVRSTHPKAWYRVLKTRYGEGPALETLNAAQCEWGGRGVEWVPLRSQLKLLNEVELRFGNGSQSIVRYLAAEAVRHYPSVRRLLMRALPLRLLIDLTPGAYLKEFNHGRIEIDQSQGRAKFRQYDWLSSPARCAAWLGSYEGVFAWMGTRKATVTKGECMLRGDDFCGYVATWDE